MTALLVQALASIPRAHNCVKNMSGCAICRKQKEEAKKKACCADGCNAIVSNVCYSLYVTTETHILSIPSQSIHTHTLLMNDNRISSALSEYFHPPEGLALL
ncbi:MAG: hypothetical protein C4329_10575 [Chitinophagaceae bacterium]